MIATGSEAQLAREAAEILAAHAFRVRVVAMPCLSQFLNQSAAYQAEVLPKYISKRVVIEAGVGDAWYRLVGEKGIVIGINRFGLSAPMQEVFKAIGLTVDHVVHAVQALFMEKCES